MLKQIVTGMLVSAAAVPAQAQVTPAPQAPTNPSAPVTTTPVQPRGTPVPPPPEAQTAIPPEGKKAPVPTTLPSGVTSPAPPRTGPAPAPPEVREAISPEGTKAPATPPESARSGDTSGTPDQVKAVIEQQFTGYDLDSSGTLDKAEFAAWMNALKARAPGGRVAAQADPRWNDAAFRRADADRSASVTRQELASFLGTSMAVRS